MTELDQAFNSWLDRRATLWKWRVESVATQVGRTEVANRLNLYPLVGAQLNSSDVDWRTVFDTLKRCWPLTGQYDAIRLNAFLSHHDDAVAAIARLLFEVKSTGADAVDRFIVDATDIGYTRPPNDAPDRPGAALLGSVILSCYFPQRFVDFRRNRWEALAQELHYARPLKTATTGEWVVWAGNFATKLRETETYQKNWSAGSNLWTIAGICWDAQRTNPPEPDPPDPAAPDGFLEGEQKSRLHLIRERNRTLVQAAKALRATSDPALHCEACDFSYVEKYGARGEGFVEAHHTVPISSLTRTTKTKVEDLALLCANCHRMIHRAPMLSVAALKKILQS